MVIKCVKTAKIYRKEISSHLSDINIAIEWKACFESASQLIKMCEIKLFLHDSTVNHLQQHYFNIFKKMLTSTVTFVESNFNTKSTRPNVALT